MSTSVLIRANGPIIVRGKVRILDSEENVLLEDNEAFLCRCGHSKNKPFCDGQHKSCGFTDAAEFNDDRAENLEDESECLEITVKPDAMLVAKGAMTIQNESGTSTTTRNKAALCRCGESNKKPFCDVSHKRCNFVAK